MICRLASHLTGSASNKMAEIIIRDSILYAEIRNIIPLSPNTR